VKKAENIPEAQVIKPNRRRRPQAVAVSSPGNFRARVPVVISVKAASQAPTWKGTNNGGLCKRRPGWGWAIDGFYSLIELDKQAFIASLIMNVDERLEARDLLFLS
jgi:hypothetical protein